MKEQAATTDIKSRFSEAGFEVAESNTPPGSVGVKKYNCVQYVELSPKGEIVPLSPPYFIVRGLNCELEDRGYQKFWYHQGTRFPIQKSDLHALHRFEEEVRAVVRWQPLYNESLGTTCARTVYDRVEGRPED